MSTLHIVLVFSALAAHAWRSTTLAARERLLASTDHAFAIMADTKRTHAERIPIGMG